MESLDTNLLVRYLVGDDEDMFNLAEKLVEKSGKKFFVHETVFSEMAYVLPTHYGYTRSQIAELFDGLLAQGWLVADKETLGTATTVWSQHPKLSFEDCLLSAHAALHDCSPLWTFDRKMLTQLPNTKEPK